MKLIKCCLFFLRMLKLCNIFTSVKIKSCSHGIIATATFLSQEMVCMGCNVSVFHTAIATVTLNPIQPINRCRKRTL